MREWLVIESTTKRAVFGDSQAPDHYIPRDVAEKLLGRDLGGNCWFSREESEKMKAHPEWRDTEPPHRPWWKRWPSRVMTAALHASKAWCGSPSSGA